MAQFIKGQSGNPKGRPRKSKELVDIEKLCKAHAPEAVYKLLTLMDSCNEAVALQACKILLERAYGRPRQAVDTNLEINDRPIGVLIVKDIAASDEEWERNCRYDS